MTVGLVGPEPRRNAARDEILRRMRQWSLPEPVRWLEADEGWEQVTLRAVYEDAQALVPGDEDYAALYMHTKGAGRPTEANAMWRRGMTRALVGHWEQCVSLLGDHDIVGCHWIEQFGDQFFAGNFWWSRGSHLRRLPEPENETRWTAEVWVSLGACPDRAGDLPYPEVFDMTPGYPHYGDELPPSDEQASIIGDRAIAWPEPPGRIAT